MIVPTHPLPRRQSQMVGENNEVSSSSSPSILASSSALPPSDNILRIKEASESGRPLLSDRKAVFAHLKPRQILMSTIKVAMTQGSSMMAYYFQDQLQEDKKNQDLVTEGKITADEADREMEDWEEREWDRRVKQLPNKILNGIIKYHAVTLVMRLYEHIASLKYDELTLDRLTMDSFSASKRVAQREIDSQVIRQKTYDIGLWSTVIAYLADYTVYQVILAYTYYKYYQRKKARKQSLKVDMEDGNLEGAVALSLLTKSSSLAASRILGWYANAWGGSWGTLMYPGWGTLMAGQFCDGFIASVFDELQPVTVE